MPNRLQAQNSGGYPQELSETQLHTGSIAETLSRQALGFTRSLVNVGCMEQVLFFYDLEVFGGIRSTQPTMLYRHSLTDYATAKVLLS